MKYHSLKQRFEPYSSIIVFMITLLAANYFWKFTMIGDEDGDIVTWFGLDPDEIRSVVLKNRLRGIDRITPVGKAMDIGVIWDGYDLVRMLSRLVNVE